MEVLHQKHLNELRNVEIGFHISLLDQPFQLSSIQSNSLTN